MSQYNAGTVTLANASATVVGSGTAWTSALEGCVFKRRAENTGYVIQSVDQAAQELTLSAVYAGASGSSISYEIYQDFTANMGFYEGRKGEFDLPYLLTQNFRKIDEKMTKEVRWFIPGTLSAAAEQGGAWLADFAGLIVAAIAYRKTAGTSGSTIVDVNIDGVSIFTTLPTLTPGDLDGRDDGVIDAAACAFAEGSKITVDIDQKEGGSPADLTVQIILGSDI